MNIKFYCKEWFALVLLVPMGWQTTKAQSINWTKDGSQYYQINSGEIFKVDARDDSKQTAWITKDMLTPQGKSAIGIRRFSLSDDGQKVLINNNTKKSKEPHFFVFL